MKTSKTTGSHNKKGIALITALIFLAVFGALAAGVATMSGVNIAMADNQKKANLALESAHSGAEIMRYVLGNTAISGKTPDLQIVAALAASIGDVLGEIAMNDVQVTVSGSTISISTVVLNSQTQQSFSARITRLNANTMQLEVTGFAGSLSRKVVVQYDLDKRAHSVFDFGVATKGPLSLAGNIELDGVNVAVESSVYIESPYEELALSIIGNSQIAGNVSIANPDGYAHLQGGQAAIGGERGEDAHKHVHTGVPAAEFPEPDPQVFEQYATGDVITESSITDGTFTNATIESGANTQFSGHVTINGILYIKQPNSIDFGGGVTVNGLIVAEGDVDFPSEQNNITFRGNVSSSSVANLPEGPEFDGLRDMIGTFLIAPGFRVSIGGNFSTINGAIAASGVEFFGNAGGTIAGSVINYSAEAMTLTGNSDLYFNRSGIDKVPAGFEPQYILSYRPSTYSEPSI